MLDVIIHTQKRSTENRKKQVIYSMETANVQQEYT